MQSCVQQLVIVSKKMLKKRYEVLALFEQRLSDANAVVRISAVRSASMVEER